LNNWLVASKVSVIISEFNHGEIIEKKEGKAGEKSETALKRKVQAMMKTMEFKRDEQLKRMQELDRQIKADAKEYYKMTKLFVKKIDKYEKSLIEHSKLVGF